VGKTQLLLLLLLLVLRPALGPQLLAAAAAVSRLCALWLLVSLLKRAPVSSVEPLPAAAH
jgi:hypothetical protein